MCFQDYSLNSYLLLILFLTIALGCGLAAARLSLCVRLCFCAPERIMNAEQNMFTFCSVALVTHRIEFNKLQAQDTDSSPVIGKLFLGWASQQILQTL